MKKNNTGFPIVIIAVQSAKYINNFDQQCFCVCVFECIHINALIRICALNSFVVVLISVLIREHY